MSNGSPNWRRADSFRLLLRFSGKGISQPRRYRLNSCFPLTAPSPSSDRSRRLVMLRFGERFAFGFGADHVANLSQHLNVRREWVAIIIDDPPKLRFQGGGLFVG